MNAFLLLLAVLSGAALLVSVAYLRVSTTQAAQDHHRWMALFAFLAAELSTVRIFQLSSAAPTEAMMYAKLYGAATVTLPVLWLVVIRKMADQRVVTPFLVGLGGLLLSISALLFVPDTLFTGTPLRRVDPLGNSFWGLTPGPWAPLIFLALQVIVATVLYTAWTFPRARPVERRILLSCTVCASLAIEATAISATIAPWFPPLGVLAVPVLVLTAAAVLGHQVESLHHSLEQRVEERTSELRHAIGELELAVHEAVTAREAQARFLANISHELRTPLTGVLSALELIQADPLRSDLGRLTEAARRSGTQLTALIDDLLDAARLEGGMLELELTSVDLRAMISNVVAALEPHAAAKGLLLTASVHPNVPDRVSADSTRVRQIIDNLLSNALKFTTSGSVSVDLSLSPTGRCTLSVTDTGPGLGTADPERLFVRFKQADDSTTRKFGGSGLGLAISRSLARMMGGDLIGQNLPSGGAQFTFSAPFAPVENADPHAATVVPPTTRPQFQGQVLLVDDDGTNRMVISRVLAAYGVDVVLAEDGQVAVENILEHPPDLVLMDCLMPRMDGFEATSKIRATPEERVAKLPIVALTASANAENREQSKRAGMDDILSKPLARPELERVLALYLEAR